MPIERRYLRNVKDDPDELLGYLKERALRHDHFKYYGTYGTIRSIIDSRHLLLSRGNNWNDTVDRKQFQESRPGYVRFGTCLSFSMSENVAMWMLYGGTQKDGAMIDFRKGDIAALRSQSTFELGRFEAGRFFNEKSVSEGCALYPLDVLYCGANDDGSSYALKRGNESVARVEAIPAGDGLLVKSYPWSYENETRLVLDVPAASVDDTITHAWIPLRRSGEELLQRSYLAPNSDREDPAFKRSTLRGTIDWDICSGCTFKYPR